MSTHEALKQVGLADYLRTRFPSQAEAIRNVWKMEVFELPEAIRGLPEENRRVIVACYAEEIFLTMEKYPEQLAQGYLWLTSCEPNTPNLSTGYARDGQLFYVGVNLPNWGYGYDGFEIQRKHMNDGGDSNSRKPLFIPIERLQTDHMPEMLEYYNTFRLIYSSVKSKRSE